MKIHLWGTDFRRSTADMRLKLCLAPESRAALLREMLSDGFHDLVYLYTCNRVEFYTTADDPFVDLRSRWLRLLRRLGLDEEAYYRGYALEGKAALRHLVRVACSLESLVIGEPQILGQLKDAVRQTKEWGLPLDGSLERCFQFAFETAKRVRTETAIGERPVSVANLGLMRLQALEPNYPLTGVTVIGRGPISRVVVQWFKKNRPECPIVWANRTVDTLRAMPESEGTEVVSLTELLDRPRPFSHLFTATSSREPVFGAEFFRRASLAASGQRKVVFDFAEPPDVERDDAVYQYALVHGLEDFRLEAEKNAALREQAVRQAEGIIESALRDHCLSAKETPLLKDFSSVEPRVFSDLDEAMALLAKEFPGELQIKLRRWAEKLVKRNLHSSREHLREVIRSRAWPSGTGTL